MEIPNKRLIAGALLITAFFAGYLLKSTEPTVQGWTKSERADWYWDSQGSRLLPYKWFLALQQPGKNKKFSDEEYLTSFGHLAAPKERENRLPIGFAIDRQSDKDFVRTKLRWYTGQKGDTDKNAEPWVGFNCAACHTAKIHYKGSSLTIDGGPSFSDLQAFVAALDQALRETLKQDKRFEDFAKAVLLKNDAINRKMLKEALEKLVEWQLQASSLAYSPLQYGRARLDAFGHIFNKIEMYAAGSEALGNPADAPVSFPFLWGINKHDRVQWNGQAKNIPLSIAGGRIFDIGALGRNAAEALGVFAEVVVKKPNKLSSNGPFSGYPSSINIDNLEWFESLVAKLETPKWPTEFPSISDKLAKPGKVLFDRHCVQCHKTAAHQKAGKSIERMIPLDLAAENHKLGEETIRTDIWMACNIINNDGRSGILKGTKVDYFSRNNEDERLKETDSIAAILGVSARGALVGKKGDIARTAVASFLGLRRFPKLFDDDSKFNIFKTKARRDDAEKCFNTLTEMRAYKARPLDGIWATAPYLHNGSIPTLYHLLLPAKDRPKSFWIGSREYDPKYVGFLWKEESGSTPFKFNTVDEAGDSLPGNANIGHEYGSSELKNDTQRFQLLEYLKTL